MSDHNLGIRTRDQDDFAATDQHVLNPPSSQPVDARTGNYATPTQYPPTPAPATAIRHDDDQRAIVRTETVGPRLDRVRWSSIWAGLAVALALYLFLQLALVATGIVDLAETASSDAWWSAGAALVAFLVGGIVAGATAVWRDADDGLLHGIVMWAVGLVALIALAAFSGGIALGSFDTSNVFDQITNADTASVSSDAEESASWAIIGLTSALVASALGATIGSKMWPRRQTDPTSFRR